jgi:P-type Ca2+ transporter type 2C
MEALHDLGSVEAKVRRDGKVQNLSAEAIVPGDVVLLESGGMISADLRLIEAAKLQVDESALTGESVPVSKQSEPIDPWIRCRGGRRHRHADRVGPDLGAG